MRRTLTAAPARKSYDVVPANPHWATNGWTEQKETKFLELGYRRIELLNSIVNNISWALSNPDHFRLRAFDRASGEEIENHELCYRFNVAFAREIPASNGRIYLTRGLLTSGVGWAEVNRVGSRMAIIPTIGGYYKPHRALPGQTWPNGERRLISHYSLHERSGKEIDPKVPVDRVLRVFNPHPTSLLEHESPMAATALPASIIQKAQEIQYRVLDNHGFIPAWFVLEGATGEVIEQADESMLSRQRDPNRKGAIRAIGGPGKVKFVRGFEASDVAAIGEIPKMEESVMRVYRISRAALFQNSDETFANSDSAKRDHLYGCLMAWGYALVAGAQVLAGEEVELRLDASGHPWMETIMESRYQRAILAHQSGAISVNEARVEMGYDPLPDAWANEVPKPVSPSAAPPWFGQPVGTEENPVEGEVVEDEKQLHTKLFDPDAIWGRYDQWLSGLEAGFRDNVNSYLGRQRKRLRGALNFYSDDVDVFLAAKAEQVEETKDMTDRGMAEWLVGKIFDVPTWNDELVQDASDWFEPIIVETASRLGEGLGTTIETDAPWIRAILEDRVGKITQVNESTRELLVDELTAGLADGSSVDDVAAGIDRALGFTGDGPSYRATRIAQTETTGTVNELTFQGFQAEDVEEVSWVSSRDGKVRESHALVDGERVKLGERFSNGLRYPGDPAGPPEETINCRCLLIDVTDPE